MAGRHRAHDGRPNAEQAPLQPEAQAPAFGDPFADEPRPSVDRPSRYEEDYRPATERLSRYTGYQDDETRPTAEWAPPPAAPQPVDRDRALRKRDNALRTRGLMRAKRHHAETATQAVPAVARTRSHRRAGARRPLIRRQLWMPVAIVALVVSTGAAGAAITTRTFAGDKAGNQLALGTRGDVLSPPSQTQQAPQTPRAAIPPNSPDSPADGSTGSSGNSDASSAPARPKSPERSSRDDERQSIDRCGVDDDARDHQNGQLPASHLCDLPQKGHKLHGAAAEAFARLNNAYKQEFGKQICVGSSYRTFEEQASLHKQKPVLAAKPGTSNHGFGLAVDLCGGADKFGTPQYDWMAQNAGKFDFENPSWARQGGSKPEPWHWEYTG